MNIGKNVTCIRMIRTGYQNADTMTAAQCSVNFVKAVRRDMNNCGEVYQTVNTNNGHTLHTDPRIYQRTR